MNRNQAWDTECKWDSERDGKFIITMKWEVNKSHRFAWRWRSIKRLIRIIHLCHSVWKSHRILWLIHELSHQCRYRVLKDPKSKIQPHTIYKSIETSVRHLTNVFQLVWLITYIIICICWKILLHLSCWDPAQIVDLVCFSFFSFSVRFLIEKFRFIQLDFLVISYLGLFSGLAFHRWRNE